MVRLLSFIFFAFIFSCTIIEDDDISSQAELDELKLVSIDIEQQASGGTSTSTARVTSETAINIAVPGGTLTRQIWMDWPALGSNSKLKLKSGSTGTFKSYTSVLSSGKPWTFYLFTNTSSDSTLLELYTFRYDANGRLASIITRAPYADGVPATSRDTLIYSSGGRLSSIVRKYPATGATSTFTDLIFYSSEDLSVFTFQGMKYAKNCQQPSCGGTWGGNYNVLPISGFPTGVMNLSSSQKAYLSMQDFNNIDQSICNGNPCNGWIDTFYFHPMMILYDQFELKDDLLFIYMVDWWQPSSPQQSTNNEKVTFTFKYDF